MKSAEYAVYGKATDYDKVVDHLSTDLAYAAIMQDEHRAMVNTGVPPGQLEADLQRETAEEAVKYLYTPREEDAAGLAITVIGGSLILGEGAHEMFMESGGLIKALMGAGIVFSGKYVVRNYSKRKEMMQEEFASVFNPELEVWGAGSSRRVKLGEVDRSPDPKLDWDMARRILEDK